MKLPVNHAIIPRYFPIPKSLLIYPCVPKFKSFSRKLRLSGDFNRGDQNHTFYRVESAGFLAFISNLRFITFSMPSCPHHAVLTPVESDARHQMFASFSGDRKTYQLILPTEVAHRIPERRMISKINWQIGEQHTLLATKQFDSEIESVRNAFFR